MLPANVNMPQVRRIYVGLGGNVGNVVAAFGAALELLAEAGLQPVRLSPVYKSAPVGGVPQPDFYNAVAELETALVPARVLDTLRQTEEALGRSRTQEVRWGPRTLDLDYLLDEHYQTIETETLSLPHPRMWERAFVVVPLADLRPDLQPSHSPNAPAGIAALAAALAASQGLHRAEKKARQFFV